MAEKACAKCQATKPVEEFSIAKMRRDGRDCYCLECKRSYHAANHTRILEQKKEYLARNRQTISARKQARYRKDHDASKAKNNAWYARNREAIRARRKAAYSPEKAREQRQKGREKTLARLKQRRLMDPKWRLDRNMQAGVWRLLVPGTKRRRTYAVLGYTSEQLQAHLERKFLPGMTWANYGEWHVDHKIPLSAFNYQTPDDIDFKRAWALTNLQPLWATDNRKKNNTLSAPFQPSLALAEAA